MLWKWDVFLPAQYYPEGKSRNVAILHIKQLIYSFTVYSSWHFHFIPSHSPVRAHLITFKLKQRWRVGVHECGWVIVGEF